jgi:ribonuclease HII
MPASFVWGDFPKLKDSKKLSPQKREEWLSRIEHDFGFFAAVSFSSAGQVDHWGIVEAANKAAARAAARAAKRVPDGIVCTLACDKGLSVRSTTPRMIGWNQSQTIRGDETIPAIAFASIVAKVKRDALMIRLCEKHPLYGFSRHKGYGTVEHRKAIRAHGVLAVHRTTFLQNMSVALHGESRTMGYQLQPRRD